MADVAKTPGLSKKTKAQLIDIILRKDDKHKEQNKIIDDMKSHLKVIINDRDDISKENEQLKSDNEGLRSANLKVNEDNIVLIERNKSLISEVEDKTRLSEELKDEIDDLTESVLNLKHELKVNYYGTIISCVLALLLGWAVAYVF